MLILLLLLFPTGNAQREKQIEYRYALYGFTFSLPESWKGFSVISSEWEGMAVKPIDHPVVERGPILSIRNPKWTPQNPYQDIPIMVFSIKQWNLLKKYKIYIGAAPIGPGELGRNSKYVFALPPRYNYAFPTGYEEVERILRNNPLHGFEPKQAKGPKPPGCLNDNHSAMDSKYLCVISDARSHSGKHI